MGYFSVLWTSNGYTGAPGYTKLKFVTAEGVQPALADVNTAVTATRGLLSAFGAYMPTGVNYTFQNPVQWFNNAGVLQGEISSTAAPATINGAGGTAYPGGCGAVMYWITNAINGGHKVRGRTFIVPLANAAFASDGTLQTAVITAATNAINTYVGTNPSPGVNTRTLGQPDRINATYVASSGVIKDRTAFLRTRRT